MMKTLILAIALVAMVGMVGLILWWGPFPLGLGLHGPVVYEVPSGFRGWVVVQYEDPACPPLGQDGPVVVISVPSSGKGCTSDPPPEGGGRRLEFRFVEADGSRTSIPMTAPRGTGMVWGFSSVEPDMQDRFFIGTEAELESRAYPRPPIFPSTRPAPSRTPSR